MAIEPPQGCIPAPYRRRRPDKTVLYGVVQAHFETYLCRCGEGNWDGSAVPAHVEREFRRYLECGILAHGFARARCAECGHDFLVAYSCKGRGVCPSCNTRRMAETAAHLVDHVFPRLPVRQWVLSLPKRLRYFLRHDARTVTAVLKIFLRVVEQVLRERAPGSAPKARLGAVSFVHRFGAALNQHLHFHCCVIDGVFEPGRGDDETVRFREAALSDADTQRVQALVRQRVLRWFVRHGYLEKDDAKEMGQWDNSGGFSVDASVRIEANDRAGLERLLRYCARPPFALERLEAIDAHRLIYRLPKPRPDGSTELLLSPLELIQRLAALIPPPRGHRHRYHGVLAPNATLRTAVTALARDASNGIQEQPGQEKEATEDVVESLLRSPARYLWAMLLARIYESAPLACPHCGADMRIIAFVTDGVSVRRILNHIGEPAQPPRIAPARGPPAWEAEAEPLRLPDPIAQPEPDFQFDQTVSW
jgi:DNA-directed RNA polymerase subunit RPC12/RpoP